MKISPTWEEFQKLASQSNLIGITTELSTDLDTPVSIYYKLIGEGKGFMLESVDTTQQSFGRYTFLGAEPFVRLQVFKNKLMIKEGDLMKSLDGSPVETIQKYMANFKPAVEDKNLPLVNGGLIGYFNFDVVSTFDRIRNVELGDEDLLGQFMICRILVVLDSLKNSARLIYFADVHDFGHLREIYDEVVEKISAIKSKLDAPLIREERSIAPRKSPVNFLEKFGNAPQEYLDAIQKAKDYIFAGDIFQVVPSRQFREKITKPSFDFYRRLRQVNPSPYMFYLNFGSVKLVGASPEMLVKVSNGTVFSYPIAGTRRRGKNDQEDLELAQDLLADEKERAEHAMLVDLARNDIGRIAEAGSVKVPKLAAVEYFSHVMHLVSHVQGKLKSNLSPMDVLKATFPAGTVSGAPKLRAMEIIHELEPVARNSYAGTVGYMDFVGNLDMCITLRTMRIENDDTAVIQSGGGIVADSIPFNEYQEILQKSKALFEVVEEVENDVAAFR